MTEKKLSANFHEFFFRRVRDVRLTAADYILVILVYDADTGISRNNFFTIVVQGTSNIVTIGSDFCSLGVLVS